MTNEAATGTAGEWGRVPWEPNRYVLDYRYAGEERSRLIQALNEFAEDREMLVLREVRRAALAERRDREQIPDAVAVLDRLVIYLDAWMERLGADHAEASSGNGTSDRDRR